MKKLQDMTEPELKLLMNQQAEGITMTNRVYGAEKPMFVLVMFNDPALGQYISNCRREDVILALREMADRLEKDDVVPR